MPLRSFNIDIVAAVVPVSDGFSRDIQEFGRLHYKIFFSSNDIRKGHFVHFLESLESVAESFEIRLALQHHELFFSEMGETLDARILGVDHLNIDFAFSEPAHAGVHFFVVGISNDARSESLKIVVGKNQQGAEHKPFAASPGKPLIFGEISTVDL